MKIQNALVSIILDRSQWYFAHVTTVILSWQVQNIVVIGSAYFTPECFKFSSNFEFDRNMLSGTGASSTITRQIWGIWKLRPAYSPETPNLGQKRWCLVPCDLEIWWMTLENNRAPLLCCFKLCATFHNHQWIQTGVAVQKRPISAKFDDF